MSESERRRVALVTGADSGIGKASAVRLAQDGLDLAITWSTDRDGAEETGSEVEAQGGRALVRHLDITDREETLELANTVAGELAGWTCSSTTPARAPASPSSSTRSRPGGMCSRST